MYTCLQEAAHRSTFYFPYWNIPFMTDIVPRQREFKSNMAGGVLRTSTRPTLSLLLVLRLLLLLLILLLRGSV